VGVVLRCGCLSRLVISYDAHTLKQIAVLNTSPDANNSGIWASDTGPATDGEGNIYFATGNGKFDAAHGGRDFGNSVLKLRPVGNRLTVVDSFTLSTSGAGCNR